MNVYNDLTLVIVCYKSYELIKSNLDALKRFKTIIVDNSSCNKTYNLVKDLNNIQFIKTTNNLGYGKANNLAIANAKTEIIPFINIGALFSRATLENLAVIQIPIITDKMRVALGALAD